MDILKEALEIIESCEWTKIEGGGTSICYDGTNSDGWHFVVLSFIRDAVVYYDGTITKDHAVIRMAPEFAKEVFKFAEKRLTDNS